MLRQSKPHDRGDGEFHRFRLQHGQLATYTYDPLSRRTGLTYKNGASIAYSYSDVGDLKTLNHDMSLGTNDPHYTFTYTAAHELASEADTDPDFVWQPAAVSRLGSE